MATENTGGPDLSGILDALQKNPEIIKTAMSLFASPDQEKQSSDKSDGSADGEPTAPTGLDFDPSRLAALLPALSGSIGNGAKGESSVDRRTALLCALKPYLSRERQTAIDYMLQFGKMGDLLRVLDKKE